MLHIKTSILFFRRFYLFIIKYAVFCLQARRGHQISLEMVVSHHVWIELRTSGKAVSALSLWAIFPASFHGSYLCSYSHIVLMSPILFKSVFLFFTGSWAILLVVLKCLINLMVVFPQGRFLPHYFLFSGSFENLLVLLLTIEHLKGQPSSIFSAFPGLLNALVMFCGLGWSLGLFSTCDLPELVGGCWAPLGAHTAFIKCLHFPKNCPNQLGSWSPFPTSPPLPSDPHFQVCQVGTLPWHTV